MIHGPVADGPYAGGGGGGASEHVSVLQSEGQLQHDEMGGEVESIDYRPGLMRAQAAEVTAICQRCTFQTAQELRRRGLGVIGGTGLMHTNRDRRCGGGGEMSSKQLR